MATRDFSDLIAEPNTNLTAAAVGDYILIYDASEPLDIYKIKVISIQDVLKLTTETARQPMVTGQAAGDLFYASAAGVLARLAKGTAGQGLKMKSDASAPEWGAVGGVSGRVGGSPTDWMTQGTTAYQPTTTKIFTGVTRVTVVSNNASGGNVTFPSAYSQKPIVLLGGYKLNSGDSYVTISPKINGTPSTTAFTVSVIWDANPIDGFAYTANFSIDVPWISIGE